VHFGAAYRSKLSSAFALFRDLFPKICIVVPEAADDSWLAAKEILTSLSKI
jgi:hypothetical protein